MKKVIMIMILLISGIVYGQKVDVYNSKGELLTPKPIEKKDVPNKLKDQPDGVYKLKELNPVLTNGKYLFRVCRFLKENNTIVL